MYKNEFTGLTIACTLSPQAVDGDVCIANNGFNDQFSILICILCLIAMVIGLMGLAYLSLLRVVLSKGKAVEPGKVKNVAQKA
jgi:hypothetical protein